MEISLWTCVLVLLAFALGGVCGFSVARSRRNETIPTDERLVALSSQASAAQARAERLEQENNGLISRARQDNDVLRILAPLARQVETMNAQVQQLEKHTATQASALHQQLEANALTQQELARQTTSLTSALISTSARGTWGEVELRRIVEAAGMIPHVDFSAQLSTGKLTDVGSSQRPDLTIHLPGGGNLAVDAKVPLSALLEAQSIDGSDQASVARRSNLLKEHAKALRAHVSELIRRNYPADFPGSPQLTVLFLPTESLLSEALATDPALLEDALRSGIAITSPSSLLALLRSVAAVWSSNQITTEAQDILHLGHTLVQRLGVVAHHLDSLGASLRSSVKNYNKTIASLESRLLATARSFESLDSPIESPRPISSEEAQVRTISAGDLLTEGKKDE
ncbi:DNA recombination protein RmuC [Arcanobacterium haemolyticum]|nr:DNA recombination protein RmuC [Arcanobacterium haemolyticum]